MRKTKLVSELIEKRKQFTLDRNTLVNFICSKEGSLLATCDIRVVVSNDGKGNETISGFDHWNILSEDCTIDTIMNSRIDQYNDPINVKAWEILTLEIITPDLLEMEN